MANHIHMWKCLVIALHYIAYNFQRDAHPDSQVSWEGDRTSPPQAPHPFGASFLALPTYIFSNTPLLKSHRRRGVIIELTIVGEDRNETKYTLNIFPDEWGKCGARDI